MANEDAGWPAGGTEEKYRTAGASKSKETGWLARAGDTKETC